MRHMVKECQGVWKSPKNTPFDPPRPPLELEPSISDPHNGTFSESMGDLGQDRMGGNSGSQKVLDLRSLLKVPFTVVSIIYHDLIKFRTYS